MGTAAGPEGDEAPGPGECAVCRVLSAGVVTVTSTTVSQSESRNGLVGEPEMQLSVLFQVASHIRQNPANVDQPRPHPRDLTAEEEEEERE